MTHLYHWTLFWTFSSYPVSLRQIIICVGLPVSLVTASAQFLFDCFGRSLRCSSQRLHGVFFLAVSALFLNTLNARQSSTHSYRATVIVIPVCAARMLDHPPSGSKCAKPQPSLMANLLCAFYLDAASWRQGDDSF